MVYLSDSFNLEMIFGGIVSLTNMDSIWWIPITAEETKELLKNGFISAINDPEIMEIVEPILNISMDINYPYIKLNPEDTFILCTVEHSFDIPSLSDPKIKFLKLNYKILDFLK